MKKLLYVFVAVIVLLAAGALALKLLVPVDAYKDKALALIESKTGRKVTVGGPVSLSVFPDIALEAQKVAVSNPAWAGGGNMAEIETLRISVELFPLLSKQVVLKELTLDRPQVTLVQKGTQKNWEFATKTVPASEPETGEKKPGYGLNLGDIVIKKGKVTFKDLNQKKTFLLEDADLALAAGDLQGALTFKGKAAFEGKRHEVEMQVGSLAAAKTDDSPFSFDWKSGEMAASFDGNVSLRQGVELTGTLEADVKGLRALTGKPAGPERLHLRSAVRLSKPAAITTVDLSKAHVELDDLVADGHIQVKAGGAVPYVSANLKAQIVALDAFAPAADSKEQSKAPGKKAEGWSDEPIDFGGLKKADADINLAIEKLKFRQMVVAPANITIALKSGALTARMKDAGVYEGKAGISARANSMGGVGLDLDLAGVQAQPLLKDWMGYERLSGAMGAALHITSQGNTQRQLVSRLGGNGNFRMKDGAYKGRDIVKLIRNVSTAFRPQPDENEETKFSELSGSFTIAGGVVSNSDLLARSPLLRLTGDGTLNLPSEQINYTIRPTLVASLEGQGGKDDVKGLTVPIRITGPMRHPSWAPDLSATIKKALENPEELKETIKSGKDVLKGLKGAKGKDLLKNFLGGSKTAPEAVPEAAPVP